MTINKYYIFPYNWWPGFIEKTDANHIGFFEILLSKTKLNNFEFTNDINKANVLLEAGNPNENIHNFKKWIYKINFVGEPSLPQYSKYDIVLTSINNINNIVDLPLSVSYIHCNNFWPFLFNRPKITSIPKKFCIFIVSNPKCEMRNNLFKIINKYKKIDSMGSYCNNIGYQIQYPYWSQEYFNIIGQYKFIICCENTKMETYSTEKIVNPYLSGTIPIYWGSENIKNIFNIETMLFLEDETEKSITKLLKNVIDIDNDEQKYLEFINRPIFNQHNINYWNENYTIDRLSFKFNEILFKN